MDFALDRCVLAAATHTHAHTLLLLLWGLHQKQGADVASEYTGKKPTLRIQSLNRAPNSSSAVGDSSGRSVAGVSAPKGVGNS